MSGTGGFDTNQVTVSSGAATNIVPRRPGRAAVTIIQLGTNPVYIGNNASVTTGTGAELVGTAGASITIPSQAEVWGLASGGSQAVAVIESY